MDLRILGPVTKMEAPNYRGTDRVTPYHIDEASDAHPANQAFFWYCDHSDQLGSIKDLTKARELVRIYQKLTPPQFFEVVEITKGDLESFYHGDLLGYDISTGRFSLLGQALNFSDKSRHIAGISSLLSLMQDFFQPKLNSNGLFIDYSTASYCLDCMMELQIAYPGLWENDEVVFNVMGIWRID